MLGLRIGVLAVFLLSTASPAQAYQWQHRWSGPPSWSGAHHRGPDTTAAGDAPGNTSLDPVTRTLYVNDDSGMLTLIDASRCNARRQVGCDETPATVDVGTAPVGTGIDLRTRTLYITDVEEKTLSLFDTTRCNVVTPAACVPLARVPLAGEPLGVAIDPLTDTVYVGNGADSFPLAVIDGRTCNRFTASACPTAPITAAVGNEPIAPSIDAATRTLYVGNVADDTVSVLDIRACNGQVTTGCPRTPPTLTSGPAPILSAVDPVTHTLYVDNSGAGTLSVFDAASCNAAVTSGCGQTPMTTIVGAVPDGGMVIDGPTHSLFVGAAESDVVSVLDTALCHTGAPADACARRWPTIQVGAQPVQLLHDPSTATLYVSDHQDDALLVLDATACTSIRRSGCRDQAPAVAAPLGFDIETSEQAHTVYIAQALRHQLGMIDTSRCRESRLERCTPVVVDLPALISPLRLAADDATHTLYATTNENTAVVIDLRRCNAERHDGCTPVATAIASGVGPVGLKVNPLTHTVYVANSEDDTLMAFDGAHCNAVDRSSCGAPPQVGPIGHRPWQIAVDAATNTVYVSLLGDDALGHTVSVVDGRNCCAVKATVNVGRFPQGIVADSLTHTVYVANQASDDEPGSLSMIDTRRCNGRDTSGCGQTPDRVPAGRGSAGVVLDPVTHAVYTADSGHSTTTFIDGATCNAQRRTSCDRDPHQVAVGFVPFRLALDRVHGTLYVPSVIDSLVSIVDTDR